MNTYQPYTYLIGWSDLDRWYYGVRYAQGCHPGDFWVKYFTSSYDVQILRQKFGEPDIIQIRKIFETAEAALLWETKVLQRMKVSLSEKWINDRENRWPLKNEKTLKEVSQKLSSKFKGRKAITDGVKTRYVNQNKFTTDDLPDGWRWGSASRGAMSEETKQKISEANKGKPRNSGFKHTEETKRKLSEVKIGVSRSPMSEEHRQKISESRIGKSPSEETRRKISNTLKGRPGKKTTDESKQKISQALRGKPKEYLKGTKWITNGVKSIRVDPDIPLPPGYWFGRT